MSKEEKPDRVLDFLIRDLTLPSGKRHLSLEKPPPHLVTNGEIRRLCQNNAVIINGKTPNWDDIMEYPVWELVYFPRSKKRRTTIIQTIERYLEFIKIYGNVFEDKVVD